LFTGLAAIGGS